LHHLKVFIIYKGKSVAKTKLNFFY
jgi:hypothetical protein